jgi:hypothetical protein
MVLAVAWNDREFIKEMNNLVSYSKGFLDGVQKGQNAFLSNLGKITIDSLKEFVDSMARVDRDMLHHVYEWNQVGNPSARLFNLTYSVNGGGLTINSTLSQSKVAANGSKEPFYNKARIMELGVPVTIKPRKNVLVFESNGETVFTKKPVVINNPGGQEVQGGFEQTMDTFFNSYFSQSFLESSGISKYLKTPTLYHKYLSRGVRGGGRASGVSAGYRWISEAGANN